MGDFNEHCKRAMNPWILHFQKLGLELKCPLCLKLFSRPLLLPCDHVFCHSCIPISAQFGLECPVCKSQHANRDLRDLPFMENIINIYKSMDAAFSANMVQLQSARYGIGKGGVIDNVGKGDKGEKFEVPNKEGEEIGAAQNLNLPLPDSQASGRLQEYRNGRIELNQADQTPPVSSPSYDDVKEHDIDSNDQGSENPLVQAKRKFNGETSQVKYDSSDSGTDGYLRDAKRQKKLNYRPIEMDLTGAFNLQSTDPLTASSVASISDSEPKSGSALPVPDLPVKADELSASKTICGFCQSSKMSEATGEMLHYENGHQVEGDSVFHSNIIHVHRTCVEWAPRVYYEGESIRNLKSELARGAKLKCTRCGLKGAALGCYVKSCQRNYHVPCAKEIPKCRWDDDEFLLLCPAHSSVKFPKEKSGICAAKDITMPKQLTSQQSSSLISMPNRAKELVLCGSDLSSKDKCLLVKFASITGATVSKFWKPNITHVIAITDEKGACKRTLKVLMAILNGKWVLKIDWIKACMEGKQLADEELYEVSLDNHGCCNGPKTGRLRASDESAPKLFNGLGFYFCGDFILGYREDLQNLVAVAGGTILRSKEELVAQNFDDHATLRTMVVYNNDSPQGSILGEEVSTFWQRISEAEDLATDTGSQVVAHTWLLESMAAYKLQPLS
ncbi:BRCA1-associated RING domain protein 1 isoform X2 [Carica papaya]|uniref:BRCA1-associated RING domain protein 1 isoform X2 n=1 Tax=Carica papaya TaxID=3649 RepID=UPI000B8C9965|nr:BRCA1-associated RING domain protein 1 isoform X2 [Carica papaya]